MKTKLLTLFVAAVALHSFTSCVDPYYQRRSYRGYSRSSGSGSLGGYRGGGAGGGFGGSFGGFNQH